MDLNPHGCGFNTFIWGWLAGCESHDILCATSRKKKKMHAFLGDPIPYHKAESLCNFKCRFDAQLIGLSDPLLEVDSFQWDIFRLPHSHLIPRKKKCTLWPPNPSSNQMAPDQTQPSSLGGPKISKVHHRVPFRTEIKPIVGSKFMHPIAWVSGRRYLIWEEGLCNQITWGRWL